MLPLDLNFPSDFCGMNELLFRSWLLAFSLCIGGLVSGQTRDRAIVSGTIMDATTGETLIGAHIVSDGASPSGTMSNEYGYFNLQVPADASQVLFKYIGYVTDTLDLRDTPLQNREIQLQPVSILTDAAVIEAQGNTAIEQGERLGTLELRPAEARSIPQLFGERDVIKAIQLMPGVQATSDGGSGFFVRGGGADQNLILLDEAPVYNPSHLLGFFSVFNGDALNNADLYKSGIPARYGGRASSVLDIRMKDGNARKFQANGGIGLISSRLTVESPFAEGRGSVLVSGRRTYADLFLLLSNDTTLQNTDLYFYDLNAKVNYRLNEKHRLYLSFYNGRDDFDFADAFLLRWGNRTATFRLNSLLGDRLFLNSSVIWSDYAYRFGFGNEDFGFFRDAGIRDVQVKEDFSWYAAENHTLRFGAQWIQHKFSDEVSIDSIPAPARIGWESAVYVEDEWTLSPVWKANLGVRYARFDLLQGPIYEVTPEGDLGATLDSPAAFDGSLGTGGLEPRLALTGALSARHALKFSLERNRQFMHLVSNSAAGNPTDLWMPVSNNIAPVTADQVSIGWSTSPENGAWTLSAETYYKQMDNLLEFKVGADVFAPTTLETEVVAGTGEAYGLELYAKKSAGDLTGWISYTLSRSFRTFEAIDDGDPFPAASDRIHDVSIVGMWDINPRWALSANWVYHTGDPATFPTGLYTVDGRLVPQYTERNAGRFPAYHRLDVGLVLRKPRSISTDQPEASAWETFRGGEWTFSCYNAYGRENTYFISFQESETTPGTQEAVSTALFKFVPSISYDFKF